MERAREQSEFSDDVGYLRRLNKILYIADQASMQLDPYSWFNALCVLTREISTEMTEEENQAKQKDIISINTKITRNNKNNETGGRGMSQDLFISLHAFELSLRQVLKESGLQNRMKEDAARALN